jgi:hypothetical protein
VKDGTAYKMNARAVSTNEMSEDTMVISSPVNKWVLLGAGIRRSLG